MNKKGQALVEFIIVIPVLLLTILAVFDIVNIYQTKISLESTMEDVILDEDMSLSEDITLNKVITDDKTTYSLSKTIEVTSPFLTPIIDKDYDVIVSRTIYDK